MLLIELYFSNIKNDIALWSIEQVWKSYSMKNHTWSKGDWKDRERERGEIEEERKGLRLARRKSQLARFIVVALVENWRKKNENWIFSFLSLSPAKPAAGGPRHWRRLQWHKRRKVAPSERVFLPVWVWERARVRERMFVCVSACEREKGRE